MRGGPARQTSADSIVTNCPVHPLICEHSSPIPTGPVAWLHSHSPLRLMIELVVPDALDDHPTLDDGRLSVARELVGRQVFSFKGSLEDALALAETLSTEHRVAPVLVNHITAELDDARVVDVYMHRGGRRMSVSEGVERPRPDGSTE